MTTDPHKCPACESADTKRVHFDFHHNAVEEVRICNNCPTEYVVAYTDAIVTEIRTEPEPGQ